MSWSALMMESRITLLARYPAMLQACCPVGMPIAGGWLHCTAVPISSTSHVMLARIACRSSSVAANQVVRCVSCESAPATKGTYSALNWQHTRGGSHGAARGAVIARGKLGRAWTQGLGSHI